MLSWKDQGTTTTGDALGPLRRLWPAIRGEEREPPQVLGEIRQPLPGHLHLAGEAPRQMDERRRAMEAVWGDAEARAAGVRLIMAECRARLAADDAAGTDEPRESLEAPREHPVLA